MERLSGLKVPSVSIDNQSLTFVFQLLLAQRRGHRSRPGQSPPQVVCLYAYSHARLEYTSNF